MSESDLAKKVVAYFEDLKWDVYQEVMCRGSVADIVATFDNLVAVIECKKSFGLTVIGQAWNWRRAANYLWVAVPATRSSMAHRFGDVVCNQYGIGKMVVTDYGVTPRIQARLQRRRGTSIKTSLREEHKTFAKAGSAAGGHFTPFKGTVKALEEFVHRNPGCSLKEAIDGIQHHYHKDNTARSCIARYIEQGVIDTIRIERKGKKIHLYRG